MSAVLITPRRNFLIRALGFTAAGAAMSVPVLAIETPEQRLKHHLDGVAKAMGELFPGNPVKIGGNCLNADWHEHFRERLARGDSECACVMVTANSPHYSFLAQVQRLGRLA